MGGIFQNALLGNKVFGKSDLFTVDKNDEMKEAGIYLFAVKPQDFEKAAKGLKGIKGKMIISIMAGVTLRKMENLFPGNTLVRSMPNLGAQTGSSMTVWKAKNKLSPKDKQIIKKILSSIGEEMEVKKEDLIDVATAVAGSGPGYLYFIANEMIKDTEKLGFHRAEAEKIVRQTFKGATDVWRDTGLPVEILQAKVTSKKGTTEAGIKKLKENKMSGTIKKCISAAYKRAKELSKL